MSDLRVMDPQPYGFRIAAVEELTRVLVRPLVTLLFAIAFMVFTWLGMISGEVFASVAASMIAFWFSSRPQTKKDEQLEQQRREMIELAKALPPESSRP